jgi:L-alanine-DL-glutamate epimerase-like enolase superfamily enzyme
MDVVGSLLAEPFPQVNGRFTPPDRPGCGMTWDAGKVAQHRVQ